MPPTLPAAHATAPIFELMRQSAMNDWVGGSDPEAVGDACQRILQRYITIGPQSRLLDFGCGVGRVLLSVLKHQPSVGAITGIDIMPPVVRFCDTHIASAFPRANFQLIQGSNDHYDQFIAADDVLVTLDRIADEQRTSQNVDEILKLPHPLHPYGRAGRVLRSWGVARADGGAPVTICEWLHPGSLVVSCFVGQEASRGDQLYNGAELAADFV